MTNHQHRPRNSKREEQRTKNALDRSGGGATGYPADPQRHPKGAARFDEQKLHDTDHERKPPKTDRDADKNKKRKDDQNPEHRPPKGIDKETEH